MIKLLAAAWEVSQFLDQQCIRHAIIGGLAVQEWGSPRLTVDADFTIATPLAGSADLVTLLTTRFNSRVSDPHTMAQRTRMILVKASNGIDIDISLALPGYEDEVFQRAVAIEIEAGKLIRVCSAEDLIIHKAIAGRPQDLADIAGIIARQGERLDVIYIRQWLKDFGEVLADTEVPDRFERAYGGRS